MSENPSKRHDNFSQASGCSVAQLEYLVRIARHLTESLDLEEVLSRIANGAVDILNAYGCVILQLEADGETLTPLVAVDPDYQTEILATRANVESSFSGRAIKARRGQIFNKAIDDQRGHLVAGTPEREESVISVPLIVDDMVLGAITVNRQSHIFSDNELWLVEAFARYAAIALKNAQTYKDLQDRIAEQKKTEAALRESEAHFRELFDGIPVASWTFDKNGKILEWNRVAATLYGWSADDVAGKTMFDLMVKPENVEITKQNIEAVFRGEAVFGTEFSNFSADGSTRIFLANEYPMKNAVGVVEKGICAELDITERKNSETALKESEAHFRLLLNYSPFGVAHVEREGDVRYLNPRFTEIFDYTIEDIPDVPTWFEKLYPDEEYRKIVQDMWTDDTDFNRSTRPSNLEFKLTAKDGTEKLIKFNVASLEDGSFILTLEDVTEQRLVEEALKASEEQLRQVQKMEAVGTLAGGIAHDFNNLLTAINGQAELAMMNLPAEHNAAQSMKSVIAAGKRAAKLTEQLLAFSRLQAYTPQSVNLNQIIDEFDIVLRRLIKADITIEENLSPSLPAIMADPHQLEQILVNLVVNARDAIEACVAPDARRKISIVTKQVYLDEDFVKYHPGSQTGQYVCLTVRDTGVGMSEAVKDKIFEPFFTTKGEGRGTGLGMATVYGIVKQNQGSIYVQSRPSIGTDVKIYWQVFEKAIENDDVDVEADDEVPVGNECILLVEDNDDVRKLARQSLKILGYTVFEATHGKEALALLTSENLKPDLLFTDVVMPEMNGQELAAQFRKLVPAAKILFTSGYNNDIITEGGALNESLNFLAKPYSLPELAQGIRATLNK